MPQCGKSTVGKLVADKTGYLFKDTDRMIEEAYCCRRMTHLSCQDIFKKEGADYFRNIEKEVFAKAIEEEHVVIATGGGTPMHAPNFTQLTDQSQVFFLYCTFDTIWKRMSSSKVMPAMISVGTPFMSLQELYKTRLVHYLAYSHHKIDASSKSPEEVAESILSVASVAV
jgi:shikimate kinase